MKTNNLTGRNKLHLMGGVAFSEQGIRNVLIKINIKPMIPKIA